MLNKPNNLQHGASLLEVLITMIVLGLALLGLAGLQATSLKNNANAILRTQALMHSYDILDRIRANALNRTNYGITRSTAAPSSPSTVAQTDLSQWRDAIAAGLPNGESEIVVTGSEVVVTIFWNEREGTGTSLAHNFSLRTMI